MKADPTEIVELWCDCYSRIANFQVVKDCEWSFRENKKCPAVPPNKKFDWECDPRVVSCQRVTNIMFVN